MALIEVAPTVHDPHVPLWQPLTLVLVSTAVVTAWLAWEISSSCYERTSLQPPSKWFLKQLRRLPLLILAAIVLIYGTRTAVFYLAGVSYWHIPWHGVLLYEAIKISLLYGLWLGLIFGTLTLAKWREDAERLLGIQKALAEAQLAQLQGQLRPHFIFNALNTVSALMHTDVARADRVLAQLGDLLRASLRADRQAEVSLKEELELLEHYAEIMRERFDGRVHVQWQVADETLPARVPAMILQPLLENAFKHGIERSSAPERITIRTARVGEELRIDIHNTGPQMMNGAATGVGLQNCREWLYLLYNSEAALIVSDGEESGVLASVTLPWRPATH